MSNTVRQGKDKVRKARERVEYRVAGKAMRDMQDRVRDVGEHLKPVDLRVVLAVVTLVASWSRVSDEVSREQIASAAGCSEQVAGRSLTKLTRLGVLTWTPATHKGDRSRLALAPDTTAVSGEDVSAPSPDSTAVSGLDTTAVSLPRSTHEKNAGPPTPAGLISDAVVGSWGRHLEDGDLHAVTTSLGPLVADHGWSVEQVLRLVQSRTATARTIGSLKTRIRDAQGTTYAEAERHPRLWMLSAGEGRSGRTTSTAGDFKDVDAEAESMAADGWRVSVGRAG